MLIALAYLLHCYRLPNRFQTALEMALPSLPFTILVGSLITLSSFASASNGNGWGDDIAWSSYDAAVGGEKPVMVIVHATWCGACKALKPQFSSSTAIRDLSKSFTMVELESTQEHATGVRCTQLS